MKIQLKKTNSHKNPPKPKKRKPATTRKKGVELSSMSVDDFIKDGLNLSDDSEDEVKSNGPKMNGRKSKKLDVESAKRVTKDDGDDDDEDENHSYSQENDGLNEENSVNDNTDWTSENFSHKKAFQKLQDADPEFYKFLEENDKELLNFEDSESDSDTNEAERGGRLHRPPQDLEVGSDESDFEVDGASSGRVITLKMVQEWQRKLQNESDKNKWVIKQAMKAFHAVLARVSSDDNTKEETGYIVTGSSVFNAIIELCVTELQPALRKYLKMSPGSHALPAMNHKRWVALRTPIKFYLKNLIKLLAGVSSPHIQSVMLKHLHQMMPFVTCVVSLRRSLLRTLVTLWSTGEEAVRVVAFLCLLRLTTLQKDRLLERVIKALYLAYIRNSKFVSPSTLPGINFMRRSLAEMFALDLNVAYRHVFLYVRQLAIHLRNAVTLMKKENVQAVYNWQFVNSLHLWTDLLSATAGKPQLQPLLYPLVQVIFCTIKLVATAQYYPLRFHCVSMLIQLSKKTGTYIPVLPVILEVLNTFDFNKRHKKVSMKPVDFTCVLRMSKAQMQENGFKDTVVDKVFQLLLEYLSHESTSIAFPDLVIPCILQIKRFLKVCRVSNYCRKMKQVLEKIEETSRIVETERRKVSFSLSNQKGISAWETQLQLRGTPLMAFFTNWSKVYAQQQAKKITQNDKLADFKLPVLKKRPREEKPAPEGPVELFPSDDSEDEISFGKDNKEPKKKRGKRGKKKSKTKIVEPRSSEVQDDGETEADIVQDLKLEDLET